MTAHAKDFIADGFAALCDELDHLISRVCRHDPVLRLERESDANWTITNTVTDEVMWRHPDRDVLLRWATAFKAQHPEASFDETFTRFFEHSVRVANVIPIREGVA